jgi:quinoprotein glucose dehydrogenase
LKHLLKVKLIILFLILGFGCTFEDSPRETSQQVDRIDNFTDWGVYRGDKKGNKYSELSQINTGNIHMLEMAWEYQTRDLIRPGMQSNPQVIDGRMYFADPAMNLVALDAATGEEIWLFDPNEYSDDENLTRGQLIKGVTYWEDESGNNQRIFHFVRDLIFAVDPQTGTIIESFGQSGYIDTKENHVWDYEDLVGQIQYTSPGITYGNYLIVGSKVGEGNVSAPGDIRAYDTLTGEDKEYKWVFHTHTIPQEGQLGYDTWQWEEGMIYV